MGPVCTMFSAKQARMGRQRSNSAASPPTSKLSRPSAASLGVRVMGESRNCPPWAMTRAATFSVEAGTAVEQSMTMVPGRMPFNTPSSPSSTASTCGVPVTQRMITSDCAASAWGVVQVRAPAASRASSGWLPGCSSTVRLCPCLSKLLAMPWPIMPMPIMPMWVMLVPLSAVSCVHCSREQAARASLVGQSGALYSDQ